MKRILATILAMVMLFTIMGVTVFADALNSVKEDFDDGVFDTNLFRIGNTASSDAQIITDPEDETNKYVKYPGSAFYIGKTVGTFEAAGNLIVEFEANFDDCSITDKTNMGGLYFRNGEKEMYSGYPAMFVLKPAEEGGNLGYYIAKDSYTDTNYANYIAGAELKDGWNKIRYFFNKSERTIRLYINGEVVKDANGKTDFKFATNLGNNSLEDFQASVVSRVTLPVCAGALVDNVYVRQQYVAGGEDNDVCKVVSFSPSVDGDIPVNAESITYTFNHDIDADSVVKDEITINGTKDLVDSVSVNGKNVTIKFASALQAATNYNVDFGFAEDIYGCMLPAATFSTPTLKIVSASVPTVNADTSALLTFTFNENLKEVTKTDVSVGNAVVEWAGVKDNVLNIIVSHTAGWPNTFRKETLMYNQTYEVNMSNLESVSGLKLPVENAKYKFTTKYAKYTTRAEKARAGSPIIEENFDGFIEVNLTDKIWGDIDAIKKSLVNISNHGENKYLNLSEMKRVSTTTGKTFHTGGNGGSAYNINLYGDAAIEFDMKFDGVKKDFTFLNFGAGAAANEGIKYTVPYNNLLQYSYVEDGTDTIGVLLDDPEAYTDSDGFYQRKKANASLPIKEGEWNNIKILFNRENTTLRLFVNGQVAKNAEGKTDFEFCFGQTTANYKDYPLANVAVGAPGDEGTNVYIDNVSYRQRYATAPDGTYCELVEGTKFTPDTKVLTYTFNHDIDENSVSCVTLNGSDEYIKSVTASGKTVTVELTEKLPANLFYELDFGFTKDIYSCGLKSVEFNTEQYELSYEKFDENQVNADVWNLSDSGAVVEGNALKISKNAEGVGNISNKNAFDYKGNVIVKTSVKLNNEGAITFMDVAGMEDLVSAEKTSTGASVKFGAYESENVVYSDEIAVTDKDSYIDIAISLDTEKDAYYGYVNGKKYGPYSVKGKALQAVTSYSFALNTSAETMEVLVDDIFVGTQIFADKEEDYGFYTESGTAIFGNVEAGNVSYKATIINREPGVASFKLIITTLSNDEKRLENIDFVEISVAENGRYSFDKTYALKSGEVIKAFYLENINTMDQFGLGSLLNTSIVKAQ